MEFIPRTTSPATNNKYYIHTSGGGYNKCIKISGNQCLPNCVGYAYGRFMEEAGLTSCKLPMCNAEDWWHNSPAYAKGQIPKVGAVMCFRKGKVGTSKDGAGHVLIVEKVYDDGSILCSQSGYGSKKRFWTSTFKKPYKLNGYVFQGFIYNPNVTTATATTKKAYTGTLPTNTLKKGSKGTQVKNLQKFLNWFGNYKLVVDGDFGAKTFEAVKSFQKVTGLVVDGIFGTKSLEKAKAVKK